MRVRSFNRVAVSILVAGVATACDADGADRASHDAPPPPAAPRAPTSDYAIYRIILRDNFVSPAPDDHADGPPTCVTHEPLDSLAIDSETRYRFLDGPNRDSALTAELPAEAAPLVAALRAMDAEPPRPVLADSLAVGVPVKLVPDAGERLRVNVITLSRVAYNADSTAAMVHVARPCRVEPGPDPEEEPAPQGLALISLLRRVGDAWTVAEVVYLEMD